MDKVIIYDIEEYLPLIVRNGNESRVFKNGNLVEIFSFQTDLFDNIQQGIKDNIYIEQNEESDDCPEWVTGNIKLGAFGEELAMNYLKNKGVNPIQVSKTSSSYGFDISVKDGDKKIVFEVKTTSKNEDKFFISYHELKIANAIKDNYYIFYIIIKDDTRSITGYIIKNPIECFDIDFKRLTEVYDNPDVNILPHSFIINIKNIDSEKYLKINMLPYYRGNTPINPISQSTNTKNPAEKTNAINTSKSNASKGIIPKVSFFS